VRGARLQPTVLYRWQKQVFEALPALFEKSSAGRPAQAQAQIAELKAQLARKDEVIAEITQDYWTQKKRLGPLMGRHVAPHIRDDVVATVERSARRAGWPLRRLIALLGIGRDRFTTGGGGGGGPTGTTRRFLNLIG